MLTRTLLLASALVLTAGPAFAWQYQSQTLDTGKKYLSAWQADGDTGGYSLVFECQEDFADDPDLLLLTPQAFDPTAKYPEAVPLTISIDGNVIQGLHAGYENVNGKLAVVSYVSDDTRVKPVIDAIRTATREIVVTAPFGGDTRYVATDAATTVASFEKDCDALH